jgi:hypothetical protein
LDKKLPKLTLFLAKKTPLCLLRVGNFGNKFGGKYLRSIQGKEGV